MAKFEVVWADGNAEEFEQSDCATVEQFVNTRFGRNFDLKKYGVQVSLVGGKEKDEEKESKPAVAKPMSKPAAPPTKPAAPTVALKK